MISILIVDDSATQIDLLKNIFASEKDMQVIGVAKNGLEAVRAVEKLKPNIVTMDLEMPVMNGVEAIKHIMGTHPVPIVVISSKIDDAELSLSFKALDAGAIAVLEKPVLNFDYPKMQKKIIQTIRSMSEINVVKRRFHKVKNHHTAYVPQPSDLKKMSYEIVAVGTSVGGPQVLKEILARLPKDFPVPIVVVQHMSMGFMTGFVKWLNEYTELTIKEAEDHEKISKGFVYLAPDNYHLEIFRGHDQALRTKLVEGPPISGFCPSVTVLLNSVAETCGKNAVGVLLTGMGSDGAKGLLAMKQKHAHTFIQDQKSAVVFGMGAVALSLNAVDKIIELEKIAEYLTCIIDKKTTT